MLDLLPVAVSVWPSKTGRITYANLALVAMMRADGPHDLVGHHIAEFIHPDDLERAASSIRSVAAGGMSPPVNSYRFRRLDGSEGHVEVYSFATELKGEAVHLSAMLDITDRVTAEREREAADRRYRTLVESAPDGIVLQADGVFVYVNPSFARMVGATDPSEVIGRAVADVVAEYDRSRVARNIRDIVGGRVRLIQDRIDMIGLDGREFPVDVYAIALVEYEGRPATQAIVREVPEPADD